MASGTIRWTDTLTIAATMDIERDSINTVFQPGRPTPGLGVFLLAFTKVDTGEFTACLTSNDGGALGPLLLEFEETGDDTPTNEDGEVQLTGGDWQLVVYEQSSTTNLNPSLANTERWRELVRVADNGVTTAPVYDPCDYCADVEGCNTMDITVNVNGTFVETVTIDPCVVNTLNIVMT